MNPWRCHIYGVFPAVYNPAAEGEHREKHAQGESEGSGRTSEERPFKVKVFPVVLSSVTLAKALKSQRARGGNTFKTLCRSFHV